MDGKQYVLGIDDEDDILDTYQEFTERLNQKGVEYIFLRANTVGQGVGHFRTLIEALIKPIVVLLDLDLSRRCDGGWGYEAYAAMLQISGKVARRTVILLSTVSEEDARTVFEKHGVEFPTRFISRSAEGAVTGLFRKLKMDNMPRK